MPISSRCAGRDGCEPQVGPKVRLARALLTQSDARREVSAPESQSPLARLPPPPAPREFALMPSLLLVVPLCAGPADAAASSRDVSGALHSE